MRAGTCVRVEAPLAERVGFLLREYAHFVSDPARLIEQVSCLRGLYANEVIDRWIRLAQTGAWEQFVGDILEQHYDPAYRRSMGRNFRALDDAPIVRPKSLDDADLSIVASELIALVGSDGER